MSQHKGDEMRETQKHKADGVTPTQPTADLLAACKGLIGLCPCGGTGQIERREYDAASGEMERAGYYDCSRCQPARKALKDAGVTA